MEGKNKTKEDEKIQETSILKAKKDLDNYKEKAKKEAKEKVKESKQTSKLRKNPWMVATFVLGLFCIIVVVGNILEVSQMDKTENEVLCSVISATPAWADADGRIKGYGFIGLQNQSMDLVNQVLIPERVKMLYNLNCPVCEIQINEFKLQGTWEAYLKEGLVINCQEVLN